MSQGVAIKTTAGIQAGLSRASGYVHLADAIALRVCDGDKSRVMRAVDFNREASKPGTWEAEKVIPLMDEEGLVIRSNKA